MPTAGAEWGGVCFSTYNGVAFIFSFVLLLLVRRFSAKLIHAVCLACGGLGLVSVAFVTQPQILLFSMSAVGVAWASILSMPYAMLANVLPSEKMGFYMGVFNFFIVLPQILASLGLGYALSHWLGDNAMSVIVLGGLSILFASLFVCLFVRDES